MKKLILFSALITFMVTSVFTYAAKHTYATLINFDAPAITEIKLTPDSGKVTTEAAPLPVIKESKACGWNSQQKTGAMAGNVIDVDGKGNNGSMTFNFRVSRPFIGESSIQNLHEENCFVTYFAEDHIGQGWHPVFVVHAKALSPKQLSVIPVYNPEEHGYDRRYGLNSEKILKNYEYNLSIGPTGYFEVRQNGNKIIKTSYKNSPIPNGILIESGELKDPNTEQRFSWAPETITALYLTMDGKVMLTDGLYTIEMK